MIPLPRFFLQNHRTVEVDLDLWRSSATSVVKAESARADFFRAVPHHIWNICRRGEFTASTLIILIIHVCVNKKDALCESDSEERRTGPTKLNKTFPISGTVHWVFAMPPVFVLLAPVWL